VNSDIELIDLIKKGNHAAFEQIVTKYKSTVFNIIYSVTGDISEADDISQEVFAKIYFSINSFKGKSLFSTWLYRITVNECMNAINKKKHKTISLDAEFLEKNDGTIKDILHDNEEDIEKQIMRKETQEFVRNLILSLPEKYRIIITLKHIENLSYEEITKAMNVSMDKVKIWLFRARQNLKEKLVQFKEVGEGEL